MTVYQNTVVYALVRMHQRGHLLQQIAKQELHVAGCSVYYFERWSELFAQLSATPDDRLPGLIALEISFSFPHDLRGLGYLHKSRRLRGIPTLLLDTDAQSTFRAASALA